LNFAKLLLPKLYVLSKNLKECLSVLGRHDETLDYSLGDIGRVSWCPARRKHQLRELDVMSTDETKIWTLLVYVVGLAPLLDPNAPDKRPQPCSAMLARPFCTCLPTYHYM
jgi:hypothetical protein